MHLQGCTFALLLEYFYVKYINICVISDTCGYKTNFFRRIRVKTNLLDRWTDLQDNIKSYTTECLINCYSKIEIPKNKHYFCNGIKQSISLMPEEFKAYLHLTVMLSHHWIFFSRILSEFLVCNVHVLATFFVTD